MTELQRIAQELDAELGCTCAECYLDRIDLFKYILEEAEKRRTIR